MHLRQVRMSMQILDEIFLQCIFCAFLVEFAEVTQQLLDFSLRRNLMERRCKFGSVPLKNSFIYLLFARSYLLMSSMCS